MNTNPKTREIRPLAYFLFFIIISFLLLTFHPVKFALRPALKAGFNRVNFSLLTSHASSPDAIAIRVIPNHNHYSPSRWYISQGFTGSPQALSVDGYDAVRDGRTVYVNAANISGTTLYTNIYLISYNQDAESATKDIFSRLLSHWNFNTNVPDTGYCHADDDIICLTDSDCPDNDYCQSQKANITRDTKRLAYLKDIQTALENYKNQNNRYPILSSGTYLTNKTISTWPSWQEQLGKELGISLPFDPINQLGECDGYDPITCWNETASQFAGSLPDELPANSNVIVYSSFSNGASSTVCAVMESGYITEPSQGACNGSAPPISGGICVFNQSYFNQCVFQ